MVDESPQFQVPSDAAMARAEAKPPMYRFFRGTLYVLYMLVVSWLCLAIVLAAWRSVWGEPGLALQASTSVRPTSHP